MEDNARFKAREADSAQGRFDRLPWRTRLWLAVGLGVSRRMDRLSAPIDCARGD